MVTAVVPEAAIIPQESNASAVSWGAIVAGGVAAAAFTLFLLHLVAGLGLVSVSPWSGSGASATAVHVGGGIALILMSIMASAVGGYLAARLRTRWVGIRDDEVYFRDSAHGVLAWAFATIISATILASAAGGIASSLTQGAAANPALVPDRNAYLVDTLFRSERPAAADRSVNDANSAEVSRIMTRGLTPGTDFTAADRTRVAQLVAARTGLSQAEAEQRVNAAIVQAKTAADEARKAAAKLAFWFAAALLAGGLAAGIAGIEGGRERDAS